MSSSCHTLHTQEFSRTQLLEQPNEELEDRSIES